MLSMDQDLVVVVTTSISVYLCPITSTAHVILYNIGTYGIYNLKALGCAV